MFIQSCSSLKKPFPIPEQNGQSVFPFSDQNGTKTLPDGGRGGGGAGGGCGGAHTYSLYKGVLVLNMRNNIRAVIKSWGSGISPGYYECNLKSQ